MGISQSVSSEKRQSVHSRDAVNSCPVVMSDGHQGRLSLFGVNRRHSKVNKSSSKSNNSPSNDQSLLQTVSQDVESIESEKNKGKEKTRNSGTETKAEPKTKRFGFKALGRSASSETKQPLKTPRNKTHLAVAGEAETGSNLNNLIPFSPAGLENWKMIDDDGRSRSSSREKTSESKRNKVKALKGKDNNNTSEESNSSHLTTSLPVNLNLPIVGHSRLPSPINKLRKSYTMDSKASRGKQKTDEEEDVNYSERVKSKVPFTNICAITPGMSQLTMNKDNKLKNTITSKDLKSIPGSLQCPIQGNMQSAVPRSVQSPDKASLWSPAPVNSMTNLKLTSSSSKKSNSILSGSSLRSKTTASVDQYPLIQQSSCDATPAESPSKDSKETNETPVERKTSRLNEISIKRKDSGQGSSLDACFLQSPKSQNSDPIKCLRKSSKASESEAPLANVDFDDDSLCSIGSDDLMLDTDFIFDNADESVLSGSYRSQNVTSHANKRSSIARLSGSYVGGGAGDGSVSSDYKSERRPSLIRRQRSSLEWSSMQKMTDGTGRRYRMDRGTSAGMDSRPVSGNENEALTELISLIENSQSLEKPSFLSSSDADREFVPKEGDAAAASGYSHRRTSLKPPRQNGGVGDNEQIVLDGFTFRHIMQDLTTFKTLLFKLKRIIQQDDLRSSSLSNPSSRSAGVETINRNISMNAPNFELSQAKQHETNRERSCPATPVANLCFSQFDSEDVNSASLEHLIQNNRNLSNMVSQLQRKVDDQQMTISLLQQQMTKYECGIGRESKDDV